MLFAILFACWRFTEIVTLVSQTTHILTHPLTHHPYSPLPPY
jgi:hypothetical protein